MQCVPWYGVLAVGAMAVTFSSEAQTPSAPTPPASVRHLATIDGNVTGFLRLPNAPVLLYTLDNTAFAYHLVTSRRITLGTGMRLEHVSGQGDRMAFSRASDDRQSISLWTVPIDAKSGALTGQPQRVTGEGDRFVAPNARFSPDGRTLVYRAGPQPDGTFNLTLVPATGGAERVVANYPHVLVARWSADGKWLYVARYGSGPAPDRHAAYIERVSSSGGASEVLFPVHRVMKDWYENVVGVSPNGRVALYARNPDQFFYMTAAGATGELAVPLPAMDEGWGHDFTLESTRYATLTQVLDQRVHVLDLATGHVRALLPPGVQGISPAWSPDGRRLAVRTGNVSNYAITVVNADGSGLRRYPVSPDLPEHQDAGSAMQWSPDGRLLAFKADAWQKLALLDVNSGRTRILTRSPGEGIGSFAWRLDGKGIVAARLRERSAPWGLSIFEVRLDGTERVLRDLSAELPWARGASVISERVAIAIDGSLRVASMPVDGGSAREASVAGASSGARIGIVGHSPDGKWVFGEFVAGGPQTDLLIMSTTGEPTRILHLPFASAHRGVAMLPDGRHIVLAGTKSGDRTMKIFVVPLDGSAPREFGGVRGSLSPGGLLTLSPNGRQLAFTTTQGRYTSKILEVDFGPSLTAIEAWMRKIKTQD